MTSCANHSVQSRDYVTAVGVLLANEGMHAMYARDFSVAVRPPSCCLVCAHFEEGVKGSVVVVVCPCGPMF